MRLSIVLLFLFPPFAFAQPKEASGAVARKVETLDYIKSLENPRGGFFVTSQDPKTDAAPRPSLRAVNGAVRAWRYLDGEKLGQKFPNKEKHAAFVLECYDPKTGGFAEPSDKPDVTSTSIGVMAAMELGIPKKKFANAMDYLKENARTFEEMRIGAAAVEAWGVEDCPFELDDWFKAFYRKCKEIWEGTVKDGGAREIASVSVSLLRLKRMLPEGNLVFAALQLGQRDDGGWGKKGENDSDIESTYRVMRCFMLLASTNTNKSFWQPKDLKKVRAFVDSHRNKDGGFATKPGGESSMSGVYYCVIVSKWLDDMEEAAMK
jgi:prenyltransferase beta subunit